MAQWRKSFYELGTENLADPAVAERQRQQQLSMQQQQLSMERAAQQQSMVQAQQDAALKAMLAQQNMGLSRDRMAQQQAQFEAQQAQIPKKREHEAAMAEAARSGRMSLEEMLQQGRRDLLGAQQGFKSGESELDRALRERLLGTEIGARKTEAEADRTSREGTAEADRGLRERLARGAEAGRTKRHKGISGSAQAQLDYQEKRDKERRRREDEALKAQLVREETARTEAKGMQQQSDRMALHSDLEAIRAAPDLETQAQMAAALLRSSEAHSPEMRAYVELQLMLIQKQREQGMFDKLGEGIFGKVKIGDYEPVDYPLVPEKQNVRVLREALKTK